MGMIMSLTWRRHCNPCFKPEFPETPSQLWGDGTRAPVVPGPHSLDVIPKRHKRPSRPSLAPPRRVSSPLFRAESPFPIASPSLFCRVRPRMILCKIYLWPLLTFSFLLIDLDPRLLIMNHNRAVRSSSHDAGIMSSPPPLDPYI
jgi:hypothetical protein